LVKKNWELVIDEFLPVAVLGIKAFHGCATTGAAVADIRKAFGVGAGVHQNGSIGSF